MLEPQSLRKAVIPPSLLSDPSPGSFQSTRLALRVSDDGSCCLVFIASGCLVYKIEISLDESMVIKGKESLLIPIHATVLNSSIVNRCPHRSEIQSIALGEGDGDDSFIMGTVDSYGHLILSRLERNGADVDKISYSVLPRNNGVGEGSWAGLCFSSVHQSTVAVAHSFCRSVDVYDQDMHVRASIRQLLYPASLSFLQGSLLVSGNSVLAVAEGSQLSIWDLRVYEKGGCVQRVCGSIGDIIYTVCGSPSGEFAIGGSDRTVTIYDPRRWSPLSRWVNCSKYEITSACFSSIDLAYIYVQSIDYEVLCGQWKESKKEFSFRGDSNWLGFSKCANKDVLAGWCDSGSIFVADVKASSKEFWDEDV
ncbi:hypothetical protein HPP92_000065 [Vanilla planifolia]|uniref:Uncharacterized protein n=1 Tax=Vanilla planifolia TaxID=51239 RepID=A0A835RTS4_VANPL|nr:hypothetical protein HPP92_000065 [Vanilla planifolia]